MYKNIIRPVLFLISPEMIHDVSVVVLLIANKIPFFSSLMRRIFCVTDPILEKKIGNIIFKNPVGLAAGFDKNAEFYKPLSNFGFGFIEIGTVTPKGQPGNPKPRVFRLKRDKALINRMGFNNAGAEQIIKNLVRRKAHDIIIGGNIGKNKITSLENATEDYLFCFEKLYPYVDYFAINVSSPNTPDLRKLQEKSRLEELFDSLIELNNTKSLQKPIFLKIAPDLNDEQLKDIAELVNKQSGITGVIATNTTISRADLSYEKEYLESVGEGGLSGLPVRDISTAIITTLRRLLEQDKIIIGVGGIMSEHDAMEKLRAGADLLQLYTGFIYEGPSLITRINKAILKSKNH